MSKKPEAITIENLDDVTGGCGCGGGGGGRGFDPRYGSAKNFYRNLAQYNRYNGGYYGAPAYAYAGPRWGRPWWA